MKLLFTTISLSADSVRIVEKYYICSMTLQKDLLLV